MVIAQQIKQKEKSYLKSLHNQFNLLFFFFCFFLTSDWQCVST